jgi:hypothetical protein
LCESRCGERALVKLFSPRRDCAGQLGGGTGGLGARSSRSWARAARASRPCCAAWPASRPRTQGEVWSGEQRLDTRPDERRSELRRDRFGFVFQSGQLVPELTAEENVALPLLLGGTRRTPAIEQARKWFGRLGLDGLERRRSGELSGGQAQRVALARGLVAGRLGPGGGVRWGEGIRDGAAVAAVTVGVELAGIPQMAPVEIWPQRVEKDQFGVGGLPQEEIRKALLAR